MRTTRAIAAILVCWLVPSAVPPLADPGTAERTLTFAQRVEARRAIESVLWSHRLWPVDNGSPKPPLDAWLPAGALEREIDSDLRLSNALVRYWGRPVTAHGQCLLAVVRTEAEVARAEGREVYTMRELAILKDLATFMRKGTPERVRAIEMLLQELLGK